MEIDSTIESEVRRHPNIHPSILARLPPPPVRSDDTDVPAVYGSEDWHSALPAVSQQIIY